MATRLFNSQSSMFCEKIRIVLALKKVPYDIVDVKADQRKSLIEFSNQRKVPTMDFDGNCIQDSTDLGLYLEEKHPEPSIYPSNASDRGLCMMLEDWADEDLCRSLHHIRNAENDDARKAGEKELATHLANLDLLYAGKEYLFGKMSMADISIFAQLHFIYHSMKMEIPGQHKNVHGLMDRMMKEVGGTLQEVA